MRLASFANAVLFAGLLAVPVAAQRPALSNGTFKQCFEQVRPADLRRVAAFITSDAPDSARAFSKPAALLLEIVGERLRASLGAKPGDLPIAEPSYTKDNTFGAVRVTLFRDGRMAATIVRDTIFSDPANVAGTATLGRLLRAAWDEGERVFWPEKAKGDSASFRISFWAPLPLRDGTPGKAEVSFAIAAFFIALPWVEQATADNSPKPVYPDYPRSHNIEGRITMSFVVDTTGHALMSTMRDVLPFGAPRPVGDMADYYRDFVRAVADAMPKTRFHSATLAGCRFPQEVLLPFDFKLNSVR